MTIMQRFLNWLADAPAARRVEAASTLTRAYFEAVVAPGEREEMRAAMALLAEDPACDVRGALAFALARRPDAPAEVVRLLAADVPRVAAPVLMHSPVLSDAELVDIAIDGAAETQGAIAARAGVSAVVSAALAELASPLAAAVLLRNATARMKGAAWDALAARFGDDAELRAMMLDHPDLPLALRHRLTLMISQALGGLAEARFAVSAPRSAEMVRDSGERATLEIARTHGAAPLVAHLHAAGELTPALLLRALFCGDTAFVAQALARLCDTGAARTAGVLARPDAHGFAALYRRAGMPDHALPAFRAGARHLPEDMAETGAGRLGRLALEDALAAVRDDAFGPTAVLLRRLLAEAQRADAADRRALMATPLRLTAA